MKKDLKERRCSFHEKRIKESNLCEVMHLLKNSSGRKPINIAETTDLVNDSIKLILETIKLI